MKYTTALYLKKLDYLDILNGITVILQKTFGTKNTT